MKQVLLLLLLRRSVSITKQGQQLRESVSAIEHFL
jgi:hypothetical protein